ncbi:hypothetical protein AB0F81_24380 [Actinoplanes sp. NPDC024001]|uniref:hypothetical protein n=1 Tax=Actinoplanes sp. NPDC024001 TaxID=3154598 RepID=UPI0033C7A889
MTTHSQRNDDLVLPWRSGRYFKVWRYGIGHSQLLLRSRAEDGISILCEAVELMRLRRSYPDLVLRYAGDGEPGFEELAELPIPQLRLVLESPGRVGLISCSRVTIRRTEDPDDDSWHGGTVLYFSTSSRG